MLVVLLNNMIITISTRVLTGQPIAITGHYISIEKGNFIVSGEASPYHACLCMIHSTAAIIGGKKGDSCVQKAN